MEASTGEHGQAEGTGFQVPFCSIFSLVCYGVVFLHLEEGFWGSGFPYMVSECSHC